MKRICSLARFLLLCLLLWTGAFCTIQAQGFFVQSPRAFGVSLVHIENLPGGYQLQTGTSYLPLPDSSFYISFGDLRLDTLGNEVSWDSIALVTGPTIFWNYAQLSGTDLIRYTQTANTTMWTVEKVHLDGTPVWSHFYSSSLAYMTIVNAVQNQTGDIFLSTTDQNTADLGGTTNMILYKYDNEGELLWTLNQPSIDSSWTIPLISPTQDGGCLLNVMIIGPTYNTSIIQKISVSGEIMWSDTTNNATGEAQENSLGDIFINMVHYVNQQVNHFETKKYTSSGQPVWSINDATATALATNGDFLSVKNNNFSSTNFFARYDSSGTLLWKKNYSFLPEQLEVVGSKPTPDNGFILAIRDDLRLRVLKMDAEGNVYPGSITGKVAIDENVNCLIDSVEPDLVNWKIQLLGTEYSLYTTIDSSGYYNLQDIPGDNYEFSTITPSTLWESCIGELNIVIPDTGTLTINQDFPIQVLADCPFMTVDIGTPVLRRCFASTYSVHYCNEGTITADSAYVQVILDPFLNFISASIPYSQTGDTVYFSLGSVPSLACGDFSFNVTVDCDSAQLGQTLCVSARIFPDTICNPPANWSGALLEGSGYCDGDSVRFALRNIGVAPTSNGLNFIIADDHVIMLNQPLPTVQPGNIHNVTVPANGTTWRLIADQEPNAPGNEMPSVGVEGCGPGVPNPWGFLLQFANRDGNPFADQDCHEVVGSYDPNDKQAFPIGVDSEHFIEPSTPLDYQIRFQNTGTDTAFTVVVKDTLSAWLDPATFRPGASSHPYTWALSGAGILTFSFENILLPDSNANEAASHGFLQFSIDQRPENPLGALLENRAGIYFDFNPPVMTNTVWHTIGYNFLTSSIREPKTPLPLLQVSPNPAHDVVTVSMNNFFQPGQQLILRNILGTVVQEIPVLSSTVEIQRSGTPIGLYFIELKEGGKVLGTGKVIWQ